jgi:hypothetical protein
MVPEKENRVQDAGAVNMRLSLSLTIFSYQPAGRCLLVPKHTIHTTGHQVQGLHPAASTRRKEELAYSYND